MNFLVKTSILFFFSLFFYINNVIGSEDLRGKERVLIPSEGTGKTYISDSKNPKRSFINNEVVYNKQGGLAIYEGDIILGTVKEVEQRKQILRDQNQAPNASVVTGDIYRWPNNTLPYSLKEIRSNTSLITLIYQVMDYFREKTNVDFVEVTDANKHLYPNYIYFQTSGGCASYVGRLNIGPQPVMLSEGCQYFGVVVHELAHALGLWHEQSRNDRNNYIRILWGNIFPGVEYNFEIQSDGSDINQYDYSSIMHYSSFAFSKNGLPTIVPLQDGVTIGQRNGLSSLDIAAINLIYPKTDICVDQNCNVELQNGISVNGVSANKDKELFYFIDIPQNVSTLTFEINGGNGDADLYTLFSEKPTDEKFNCRPYITGNNETCTHNNPEAGKWFARIKPYRDFANVSLKATYVLRDGNHNIANACATQNPVETVNLESGNPVCVLSKENQYVYFYFYNQEASQATIKLAHGSGSADLYYSPVTWPSLNSHSHTYHYVNNGNTGSIVINNIARGWNYIMIDGNHKDMTLQVDY